jgi:hypothetical protein
MQDSIQKITKAKRAGGVGQKVKCLPSTCEGPATTTIYKKAKENAKSKKLNNFCNITQRPKAHQFNS